MATRDLSKLDDDELVAHQQDLMKKRGEAEKGFKEQQLEVQFELDKREFKRRLGRAPTAAEIAALRELEAEAEAAEASEESEE